MKEYLFTSESITEGHPDKLCDYIADCILDEYLSKDGEARVAIEIMAKKETIYVAGEITSDVKIDIEKTIRNAIKEIGYDDATTGIDYRTCDIKINIIIQSEDIALGVDTGGAGDQGIIYGYATDETKEYIPLGNKIANNLAKKLTETRKQNIIPELKPDGKVQVTIEYENSTPKRINSIVISTQHDKQADLLKMKEKIKQEVIEKVIPEEYLDNNTKIFINPTGRFIIGGPLADTGLTGRKIIVDTYGGYARHGGGSFSGKDPSKVDRSAAYMLRHIAKNIVANGYAKECEIQIAYIIGLQDPASINIDTKGTNTIEEKQILQKILNTFDLTPKGIIDYLQLKEPIYKKTTNYGHFGKESMSWEKIIKF